MAEIAETLNNYDPQVPYWSALKLAVEENKMPELHEINYSLLARLEQPRLRFSGPASYRWFSETPQNEESQPAEITFCDEKFENGYPEFITSKKVLYTYKLPNTALDPSTPLMLMESCFMGGMEETTFDLAITEIWHDMANDHYEAGEPYFPIKFRGEIFNIYMLDEEFMKTLGLITDLEYMLINIARQKIETTPITVEYELETAEAKEEFECAVCLEKGIEDVAWHPNKCHIFHRACLNQSLAKNPGYPLCRGHGGKLVRKYRTL